MLGWEKAGVGGGTVPSRLDDNANANVESFESDISSESLVLLDYNLSKYFKFPYDQILFCLLKIDKFEDLYFFFSKDN